MPVNEAGRVLLVEDNPKLNEINRRALTMAGYRVHTAPTLLEARAYLSAMEPDVILLDVMLPDGDGFEFCAQIRSRTRAHILFLTSRVQHEQKLKGLGMGGDDYITKPYLLDELLARVGAAMRRKRMEREPPPMRRIERGPLVLDVAPAHAFLNGEDMLLTAKEFALLLVLVENEGRPLGTEYLYETVWKRPYAGDGNALWTCLSRLKRKLAASGGKVTLVASRREGYRLAIVE